MPDFPLFVAKPLLPDLSQLNEMLEGIWDSKIVTNEGPVHNQLEAELQQHLGVSHARLFASGTTALLCAIYAYKLPAGAEIITTPLTFAATAHAIAACGYTPVFADVDPVTLTLDPASVERAISPKTAAVLGVHTYGTLCDIEGLAEVCDKHKLVLMFDAAHAFGVMKDGKSIGAMGDVTVYSMHATKLYNSLEGGLATTPHDEMDRQLKLVRNFGIVSEELVSDVGINGKMSEVHAAIGLLNLKLVEGERQARSDLRDKYNDMLADFPGIRVQVEQPGVTHSEQYYPIVINPEQFGRTRDVIYEQLKSRGIYARKYFWPICTDFVPYKSMEVHSTRNVPAVDWVKDKVLCLPFHSSVEDAHIEVMSEVFAGDIV